MGRSGGRDAQGRNLPQSRAVVDGEGNRGTVCWGCYSLDAANYDRWASARASIPRRAGRVAGGWVLTLLFVAGLLLVALAVIGLLVYMAKSGPCEDAGGGDVDYSLCSP